MTYYDDLSPYKYFSEPQGLKPINVGWLGEGRLFPKGETSQEFKAKLFEFCLDEYVVQIARGFHICEFCNISLKELHEQSSHKELHEQNKERYGKKAHWLSIGDGEIRVIRQSALYAAPTLIYHYVVESKKRDIDYFITNFSSSVATAAWIVTIYAQRR